MTMKISIITVCYNSDATIEKTILSVACQTYKNIEYIDADKVSDTFRLRFWKDGDRFSPLGLIGSKKVSDFLNDQKVTKPTELKAGDLIRLGSYILKFNEKPGKKK